MSDVVLKYSKSMSTNSDGHRKHILHITQDDKPLCNQSNRICGQEIARYLFEKIDERFHVMFEYFGVKHLTLRDRICSFTFVCQKCRDNFSKAGNQ